MPGDYDPNDPYGYDSYAGGDSADPRIMSPERAAALKRRNQKAGTNGPSSFTGSKVSYGGTLYGDPKDYDAKGNYTGALPVETDPLRGGYVERTPETEAWKKYFDETPGSFQNTEFNNAQQAQSRAAQQAMLQQYHALAAGDKNSVAQQQLRQSIDAAKAQALSASAGVRGVSAGAALRGAQNQQQRLGVQGNADSAMLMMQEQAQARQALLGMYGQQRTGDIAAATAGADVFGQNQGMNDAFQLYNSAQGYNVHEADRRADMDQIRAKQGMDRDLRSQNAAAASSGLQAAATATQQFAKMYNADQKSPDKSALIDSMFDGG